MKESYSRVVVTAYFKQEGLPEPVFEHMFHPTRKWRFDIAWPEYKLALEVEGLNGRHQRTAGFLKDVEKYNEAIRMGWLVSRCINKDLCLLETVNLIKDIIKLRKKVIRA